MFRRTLPKDAVLWWQGDAASSLGVVEKGRLGIRLQGRILDLVFPGTALGEAALLGVDGAPGQRGADVVVLEDGTVVNEHPVEELAGRFEAVHQLVLRTLIGQVGRNQLLVAAAHPGHPLLERMVAGALGTLARAEEQIASLHSWEEFLAAFRFLFHLREGSDKMREWMGRHGGWTAEAALAFLQRVKPHFGAYDLSAHLMLFVYAEADRLATART